MSATERHFRVDTAREAHLHAYLRLARALDQVFRVPGTSWRFGLDPLIGLVPVAGDVLGAFIGAYGVWLAGQVGAPASVMARMLLNLLVDAAVGSIPVAGDLFDFAFKANVRNCNLLERWMADPRGARRSSRVLLALLAGTLVALPVASVWLVFAGVQALLGIVSR